MYLCLNQRYSLNLYYRVNFLDIATQYAGILMGISCTFAFIPGILSPLLVGIIVTDKVSNQKKQ